MNQVDILIGCVVVLAVLVIWLAVSFKHIQSDIDRVERLQYQCVTDSLFRIEQDQRRNFERDLGALTKYMNLELVHKPAQTVVEARK